MKTLFVLPLAAVILAGCAAPPPRYAQRPVNPYDWHTVSVTPVTSPGRPGTRAGSQDNN